MVDLKKKKKEMRDLTLYACENQIIKKQANTLKEAAKIVWDSAYNLNIKTGFTSKSFEKFYDAIRTEICRRKKNNVTNGYNDIYFLNEENEGLNIYDVVKNM